MTLAEEGEEAEVAEDLKLLADFGADIAIGERWERVEAILLQSNLSRSFSSRTRPAE